MQEAPQAMFNTAEVLAVGDALVEDLKSRALASTTRRYRLCLHHSPEDALQEMLIVHCRGNYSRPHRHPGAASTMLMVAGEMSCILFDDVGRITERIDLSPPQSGRPFLLRVAAGRWHMPLCRSEQAVFLETMIGPFDRETGNQWAPWSPAENEHEAIANFLGTFGVQ
jgi:cupin fold WbuC family metalloprotein